MRILVVLFAVCVSTPVLAESLPVEPPAATQSTVDANKDGKVTAEEATAAVTADATVSDVVKDGEAVVDAATALKNKESGAPVGLLVAVLLGAIFKLLLSLLKVTSKNVAWFKTPDGKRVVKYSTLGLGMAAALMANIAFGMGWVDALTVLLSGPLAVAIHEYTSDSKGPSPDVSSTAQA